MIGPMTGDDLTAADVEYYASLPRKRVAAGALLTDADDAILVVEPTYKSHWEVPGGIVEDGETARAACARECFEELGLRIAVGRLLVVEHQAGMGARGDSLMLVYDGGSLAADADVRLPPAELRSHRFVSPDELDELMGARLANRLRHALVARRTGTVIELENGYPVAVPQSGAHAGES